VAAGAGGGGGGAAGEEEVAEGRVVAVDIAGAGGRGWSERGAGGLPAADAHADATGAAVTAPDPAATSDTDTTADTNTDTCRQDCISHF